MTRDDDMVGTWLLPAVEGTEDAEHWAAARRGALAIQHCLACGTLRHPPRPMCPKCRSVERGWRVMSGRGRVWSYVVPHPPLLPAYQAIAPYNVVVVELEEDPLIRLVGNLVGDDGAVGDTPIEIGMPVEAVFTPRADDVTLIQWRSP
jgi:uncharacterized OB-fold protein